MDSSSRMNANECAKCGGRMRNSVFCDVCGRPLCSWDCFLRHVGEHAGVPKEPDEALRGGLEGRSVGDETSPGADPARVAWWPEEPSAVIPKG